MLTESELDNILVAQKDQILAHIDTIPEISNQTIKGAFIAGIYAMIRLNLPLWDAFNYHYKAVELNNRLNRYAYAPEDLPPSTTGGL